MEQDFFSCSMEYRKDEKGNEVLLKEGKFQVMMAWEKPYMHACIDALKPFGDVLEIGFGLGFSAERIQSYHPKSHTIIEYHPVVAAKAREWAKAYPHVTIIEDTWQNALARLGVFDCIFFDDYPLHSEKQMNKMHEESAQSALLLKQGQKMLEEVNKTLPFLTAIKYTDRDLYGLMEELTFTDKSQTIQWIRFLKELLDRGQITQTQLDGLQQALIAKGAISQSELDQLFQGPAKQVPFAFSEATDRLFTFLRACLRSHMRKNSRFSCFLSSGESKFEDPQFFNEIITNPALDYHEEKILVEVPENCEYFSGNEALVITIVKRV